MEEDNWVAAAEWAEAQGADIISTSLGYLDFDAPFSDYTFQDMDGETAMTTVAAQMAAERGVVVVASAGNSGFHPDRNTLAGPADGELVLTIGAVDSFGIRVDFSSVGRTADGRIKPTSWHKVRWSRRSTRIPRTSIRSRTALRFLVLWRRVSPLLFFKRIPIGRWPAFDERCA